MDNVTVKCGCGRAMRVVGNAPRGTFACGCGSRVLVTVDDVPQCTGIEGRRRCHRVLVAQATALGLALCGEHFGRLAALIGQQELEVAQETALRQAAYESIVEGRERRVADSAARRASCESQEASVYYIRLGDRIKIGWTADLHARMHALMPDEILAVEPGPRALETTRLRQFRHLQVIGERFSPGDDLLLHITGIRKEHGLPPTLASLRAQWHAEKSSR